MAKIEIKQSSENAGFWYWDSGGVCKDKTFYKTRDEAFKAGINHQFLNACLEIVEIHHRNIERK